MMRSFRNKLRQFAKDESGLILAEALIMLPLMIWGFLALFAYWDVYKTINVAQKAAYSIADLMSRQVVVTNNFLDGLHDVLSFLTPGAQTSRMRITSFEFDEGTINQPAWDADDSYILLFSHSSETALALHTQTSIQDLNPRIPDMDDLDSVVLVETWVDYEPQLDIGIMNVGPTLGEQSFDQFIVTRPRTRRVCLDGTPGCA